MGIDRARDSSSQPALHSETACKGNGFLHGVTASLAKWLNRTVRSSNPSCDGIFPGRVIRATSKLALQWLPCQVPGVIGSRWDWSARCQYTVTGRGREFNLQLLYQCGSTYNCLSRSVPEIHSHVARTLSKQATNKLHRVNAYLRGLRNGGVLQGNTRIIPRMTGPLAQLVRAPC